MRKNHPEFSSKYLRAGAGQIHCMRVLSGARAFVILCSPLWNERNYASPLYHTLMKYLATSGFDVVLFDWTGQGNSGGESWEMSIDTMRSDLDAVKAAFLPNNDCPIVVVTSRISCILAASVSADAHVFIDPAVDAAKWFRSLLLLERTKEIVAYGKSALTSAAFSEIGQKDRIALCETVVGARLYGDLIRCSQEFQMPQNALEISLASKAPLIGAPDRWIDLHAHNPRGEGIWQTPGKFTPAICNAVSESIIQSLLGACNA